MSKGSKRKFDDLQNSAIFSSASISSSYSAKNDGTLTKKQKKVAYFRNAIEGGDFRYKSNPTLKNYSSGYHEAAVTTDTFKFLRDAIDNEDGTHTLPASSLRNSFWNNYAGGRVDSESLRIVLKYADGFRTDTAQTILSAPRGRVSGHSGSGLDTTGEAAAHDLLRKSIIEILQTDSKTKGFSEKSIATILASITVTSMAPGELARTIPGGTSSLKAGPSIMSRWEVSRNESKRRVENIFNTLNLDERTFTNTRGRCFMNSTQDGVAQTSRRIIPSLRATSPERDTRATVINEVGGGKYLQSTHILNPLKGLPTNYTEIGMSITEPFRALR